MRAANTINAAIAQRWERLLLGYRQLRGNGSGGDKRFEAITFLFKIRFPVHMLVLVVLRVHEFMIKATITTVKIITD